MHLQSLTLTIHCLHYTYSTIQNKNSPSTSSSSLVPNLYHPPSLSPSPGSRIQRSRDLLCPLLSSPVKIQYFALPTKSPSQFHSLLVALSVNPILSEFKVYLSPLLPHPRSAKARASRFEYMGSLWEPHNPIAQEQQSLKASNISREHLAPTFKDLSLPLVGFYRMRCPLLFLLHLMFYATQVFVVCNCQNPPFSCKWSLSQQHGLHNYTLTNLLCSLFPKTHNHSSITFNSFLNLKTLSPTNSLCHALHAHILTFVWLPCGTLARICKNHSSNNYRMNHSCSSKHSNVKHCCLLLNLAPY